MSRSSCLPSCGFLKTPTSIILDATRVENGAVLLDLATGPHASSLVQTCLTHGSPFVVDSVLVQGAREGRV
jgi:hypothetical protein